MLKNDPILSSSEIKPNLEDMGLAEVSLRTVRKLMDEIRFIPGKPGF